MRPETEPAVVTQEKQFVSAINAGLRAEGKDPDMTHDKLLDLMDEDGGALAKLNEILTHQMEQFAAGGQKEEQEKK